MGGVFSLWGDHGWAIYNHGDYFKLPEPLLQIVAPISTLGFVHHMFFAVIAFAFGSNPDWAAEHKHSYRLYYLWLIPSVFIGVSLGIGMRFVGEWHTTPTV